MKCPHCKHAVDNEYDDFISIPDENLSILLGYKECQNCLSVILFSTYKDPTNDSTTLNLIGPTVDLSKVPSEVPNLYAADYEEAVAVIGTSPKASAALSRRCLQNILENHFGVNRGTLEKQIEKTIENENLPIYVSDRLHHVRVIGNFAAHPLKNTNTGEIINVEPGEADWLLKTLLSLFDFCFVQPKKLEDQKKEINQKLKEAGEKPLLNF